MTATTAAVKLRPGSREPVKVATTANISALQGLLTVDGVVLATGDRILVKNQTAAKDNGIYTASAGKWRRAADATDPRAITRGVTVHSQLGTANGGNTYVFQTIDPKIGTDAISIVFYIDDDTLGAISGAQGTAVAAVNAAGTTQLAAVNGAGSSQVAAVNSAGTTQTGNVNTAGTTQVSAVNTAGATQIALATAQAVLAAVAAQSAQRVALGAAQDFNLLDNGNWVINERGAPAYSSGTNVPTALTFIRDRWHTRQANTQVQFNATTGTLILSPGTGGANPCIGQVLPRASNEPTWANQPIVAAVYITLHLGITRARIGDGTTWSGWQTFGTSAGWQFVDLTFPNSAGNLIFELDGSTAGTDEIAEVRLWPGTTHPSAINRINAAYERLKCSWFFRRLGAGLSGLFTSTTEATFGVRLDPPMRATPTATIATATPGLIEGKSTARTGSSSALASTTLAANGVDFTVNGFSSATSGALARASADLVFLDADLTA